ncbi:hypothetical protein K1T71_001650 [Dendrolimus kikuchii]|uniref:Uncharacterized protein n=1 Tax=Dendrolimus kikuchii TaxID=765133 RepID=A0ACC1DG17_9NEOP|nr:hypothetical protein K1T71_001650 [Dendrolimus kikuchii]
MMFFREQRKKDDEGTQTHTPGSVSSAALTNVNENILDYDFEDILSDKSGNVVILRTPSTVSVPDQEPEAEEEPQLEPEPMPESTLEPEVVVLEPESILEPLVIGGGLEQEVVNAGSENFEEATGEEA